VDAAARFWGNSTFTFWTANVWDSERPDSTGSAAAVQAELNLRNDRYLMEIAHTRIGSAFDPALGFVPRPNQIRWGGQLGWTPRFEGSAWARRLVAVLQGNRITDMAGFKESHLRRLHSMLTFQSGDWLMVNATERYEALREPATIQRRELPAGEYTFRSAELGFSTNDSRELSVRGSVEVGDFWSGTRTGWEAGMAWRPSQHLDLSVGLNRNDISLPVADGDFSTNVLVVDVGTAVSRKLFANALVQWDDVSETLQANIRVDWIHTPGSDLFVVLDTGYLTGDLLDPRDTRWSKRTGIVKLTWLKAF
jgi:hypothetical protein